MRVLIPSDSAFAQYLKYQPPLVFMPVVFTPPCQIRAQKNMTTSAYQIGSLVAYDVDEAGNIIVKYV
jgi:hypothetical protein